jgi:hypothetical protein
MAVATRRAFSAAAMARNDAKPYALPSQPLRLFLPIGTVRRLLT